MRGFCAIGIENCKTEINIGTLWRSAANLGAALIFTVGEREYRHQSSDTVKAWRHLPFMRFRDVDDLVEHLPFSTPLVGIETEDDAKSLPGFRHPERACYLLGAEDHGLKRDTIRRCHRIVRIPSDRCLNVAVAGSIVLYDRMAKAA